LLLAVGLGTAFYLAHMRLWVVPVRDARGQMMLWIGGASNKHREVFQEKFASLTAEIEKELATQPKARPERKAATLVSK
jgi:hypothetical protein